MGRYCERERVGVLLSGVSCYIETPFLIVIGLSVITKDFTNDTGALFMTMLAGGRDLNPRASQVRWIAEPFGGLSNTHLLPSIPLSIIRNLSLSTIALGLSTHIYHMLWMTHYPTLRRRWNGWISNFRLVYGLPVYSILIPSLFLVILSRCR